MWVCLLQLSQDPTLDKEHENCTAFEEVSACFCSSVLHTALCCQIAGSSCNMVSIEIEADFL